MEKEVSEAERRVKIKKVYSEKIAALLAQQDIDEKELYGVIRRFFADFLKLEYEFTYEELSQELNKIFIKQGLKKKIDMMLDELSLFEYMPDHELSHEEKKNILNDFKEMISQLIIDLEDNQDKRSLFDKLFGRKKEHLTPRKDVIVESLEKNSETQLPETDIVSVEEKNDEMKLELQRELLKKDNAELSFSDIVSNSGESNNLLLVSDDLVSQEKKNSNILNTQTFIDSKSQNSKPKELLKKSSINNENDNLTFAISKNSRSESSKSDNSTVLGLYKNNMSKPFLLSEDNDPELVNIKKLIEKSYNYFSSGDIESAKMLYMDALAAYNKLDYNKKTKTYIELYDLYTKLK